MGEGPGSAHTRRGPLFRARRIPGAPRHTSRAVWTAPAAPAATGALLRSPTPPPTRPWQTPGDIGSPHALEDGLGAQPALAGRRAGPPPPARPPALALSRAQRPAGGTLGPAAHGSGCPICPQPTCPPALPHAPPARPRRTGCSRPPPGAPSMRRWSWRIARRRWRRESDRYLMEALSVCTAGGSQCLWRRPAFREALCASSWRT